MATKTIGTSSRDYATFALYASYLDGLNTLSAAETGDVYNDSEFAPSATVTFTGFVTSSSNTVTIKAASGQGFKDHGTAASNPLRYDQAKGVGIASATAFSVCFDIQVDYVIIDGLQFKGSTVDQDKAVIKQFDSSLTHVTLKNIILEVPTGNNTGAYEGAITIKSGVLENLCVIHRGSGNGIAFDYAGTITATNCTAVRPSDITADRAAFRKESGGTVTLTNCAGFGFTNFTAGSTYSGSNNASDKTIGFGTSNQASLVYSSQFEVATDSTRDFRAKSGGALINNGTTGTTTDIIGQSRSGTTDIGAWELQAAAATKAPPPFRRPYRFMRRAA